jgi:hypothetical protein
MPKTAAAAARPVRRRANPTAAERAQARVSTTAHPKVPSTKASRTARAANKSTKGKGGGLRLVVDWRDDPARARADLEAASRSLLASGMPSLALVHSPMCGYCIGVRPAFEAAARTLTDRGANVVAIDVRCLAYGPDTAVAKAVGASYTGGVPHIVRLGPRGASPTPYVGDRSAGSLASFV